MKRKKIFHNAFLVAINMRARTERATPNAASADPKTTEATEDLSVGAATTTATDASSMVGIQSHFEVAQKCPPFCAVEKWGSAMYLWHVDRLVEDFRNDNVSEKEKYKWRG